MSKSTKPATTRRATKRRSSSSRRPAGHNHLISEIELARLGDGQVAYIKTLSNAEARRMFPAIKGLPRGIDLYALHAADGTPIALTDSHQAAVGHAIEGELELASVH